MDNKSKINDIKYYKIGENALRAAGINPETLYQYEDKPNELLNEIQNKVIAQYILETLRYENPYTKHFKRQALPVGDGVEILMANPVISTDYDEKKFIPDLNSINHDIKTQVIWTSDKRKFEITWSWDQLRAAFSSIERLGIFIAEYTRMLQQGVELWLWEKISLDLGKIDNTIILPKGTTVESAYYNILVTSMKMMNPSKDFNIDGQKWKINNTPQNKQLLITNPDQSATWRMKLFAPLYNISTLTPKENFADVIVTTNLNKDDYAYIVDSDAYYIDYRINITASQSYVQNMMTNTVLHLWVRSGLLKKANGVKIQIAQK